MPALGAQEIPRKGVPRIGNFTPGQYHHHGKVWDIQSADNGIVYMAGDAGLLEFDGQTWNRFRGSKGFTRSLLVFNDSLLYSGSDLDFGVWKKNALQQFEYRSLYPFNQGANAENEEFWGVYRMQDKVVFTSFTNIYVYKDQHLTKIAAPNRFSGSFQDKETIYLPDDREGLFAFNGMSLQKVFAYPGGVPMHITGVSQLPRGLLVVTRNKGVFLYRDGALTPFRNELSALLKKDQVFCFTALQDSFWVFGTILNGLYVTNTEGQVIQHINKQKGLPNNTVLSIHGSANGMLWVGMDYGISVIHLFSPYSFFFDYNGEFGTPHTALLKDGVFYLGTNQGLYQAPWAAVDGVKNKMPFSLIPGLEGQVWTLANIDGTVYCGHDKGLFAVAGGYIRKVHDEPGVWTLLPYRDEYLLAGQYNGISVFRKEGRSLQFQQKLDLILGSCNQLVQEKDSLLWVHIPNFGLIRFALNRAFYPENRLIFPSDTFKGQHQYLHKDAAGIYLLTTERNYLFDPTGNRFVDQGRRVPGDSIPGLPGGVYQPILLDEDYRFFPVYNGFCLKKPAAQESASPSGKLLIRTAEAFNNQARERILPGTSLPYGMNNLRFHFLIPNHEDVTYEYQISNLGNGWIPCAKGAPLEFLHLKEGRYVLTLRATGRGAPEETAVFPFTIRPPWFRTWWAYLGYAGMAVLLFFMVRSRQNARLRSQKMRMLKKEQASLRMQAEKYRQEALLQKQKQLEEEANLLKQQVKHKNVELAKQAKENQNKNRLLHILREKLEEAQHDPSLGKMHWAEMKRLLDMYLETEDNTFEIQIDELHQEFFQRMREKYPDLSLYDLRLCAYLKIGLNSKEISDILQVLPSSINVSRSRLRKKLNLGHDDDLYGFLNKI